MDCNIVFYHVTMCVKLSAIIWIMFVYIGIAGIPLSWIDGSRRVSKFISDSSQAIIDASRSVFCVEVCKVWI